MFTKNTLKIYNLGFTIASRIKCVPFQWIPQHSILKLNPVISRAGLFWTYLTTVFEFYFIFGTTIGYAHSGLNRRIINEIIVPILTWNMFIFGFILKVFIIKYQTEICSLVNKLLQVNRQLGILCKLYCINGLMSVYIFLCFLRLLSTIWRGFTDTEFPCKMGTTKVSFCTRKHVSQIKGNHPWRPNQKMMPDFGEKFGMAVLQKLHFYIRFSFSYFRNGYSLLLKNEIQLELLCTSCLVMAIIVPVPLSIYFLRPSPTDNLYFVYFGDHIIGKLSYALGIMIVSYHTVFRDLAIIFMIFGSTSILQHWLKLITDHTVENCTLTQKSVKQMYKSAQVYMALYHDSLCNVILPSSIFFCIYQVVLTTSMIILFHQELDMIILVIANLLILTIIVGIWLWFDIFLKITQNSDNLVRKWKKLRVGFSKCKLLCLQPIRVKFSYLFIIKPGTLLTTFGIVFENIMAIVLANRKQREL